VRNKVKCAKFISAGVSILLGDVSGHPGVFTSDQEMVLLANRLVHWQRAVLGQSVDQVRRAEYSFVAAN
jgi:hypothetical protein